ncbi:hypothetical protein BDR07DRAFT_222766 [Suillus spraguei]|nr:hypothetical protein BDR07DRAFT_222766 [Suillus spraguei]
MRHLTVATEVVGMVVMHLPVGMAVTRTPHLQETEVRACDSHALNRRYQTILPGFFGRTSSQPSSLFMRSRPLLGRADRGWALLCWPVSFGLLCDAENINARIRRCRISWRCSPHGCLRGPRRQSRRSGLRPR